MTAATTAPTSAVSPSYPPAVRLRRPLPGWVRECTPDAAGNPRAGWRPVWAVCIPRTGRGSDAFDLLLDNAAQGRTRALSRFEWIRAGANRHRIGCRSEAGRRPAQARSRPAWSSKPPGRAAAARTWEVVVDGEAVPPELRDGDQRREVLLPPSALRIHSNREGTRRSGPAPAVPAALHRADTSHATSPSPKNAGGHARRPKPSAPGQSPSGREGARLP
jgi:hypothetical protein